MESDFGSSEGTDDTATINEINIKEKPRNETRGPRLFILKIKHLRC